MRAFQSSTPGSRAAMFLAFATALTINASSSHASDSTREKAKPGALYVPSASETVLGVHPMTGTPGQTRTVFLAQQPTNTGCGPIEVSLDTSQMDSRNLVVIRTARTPGFFCFMAPSSRSLIHADLEFTPTRTGPMTVRWEGGAEVTIQTVDLMPASKFDTNGMWFDPATNGSGIALHHRRGATDAAFGTWFLFDIYGVSRWYTMQSASWQQDGSVLEGLLYRMEGYCVTTGLAACPTTGYLRTPPPQNALLETPSRARITFQSSTRARAEVTSMGGTVLFTSDLTKLQF